MFGLMTSTSTLSAGSRGPTDYCRTAWGGSYSISSQVKLRYLCSAVWHATNVRAKRQLIHVTKYNVIQAQFRNQYQVVPSETFETIRLFSIPYVAGPLHLEECGSSKTPVQGSLINVPGISKWKRRTEEANLRSFHSISCERHGAESQLLVNRGNVAHAEKGERSSTGFCMGGRGG